jgi:hypothetical protein
VLGTVQCIMLTPRSFVCPLASACCVAAVESLDFTLDRRCHVAAPYYRIRIGRSMCLRRAGSLAIATLAV